MVQAWLPSVSNFRDHQGISIVMRSKSEVKFKFSVRNKSMIEDELFQISCHIDGSTEWATYQIPFSTLSHIREGASKIGHKMILYHGCTSVMYVL